MKNVLSLVALAAALALAPPPALAAQAPVAAGPQAPTPLDRFLGRLHTLRVSFRQTLVDAHGALLSRSAGTLIVERPGKFRWSIHPLPA
ncbi:MAG: outer membrane lipoprotein carrier protein LolA, partial [Gammaproteobacteria bacterium]|nr:outer membrane lipoprotein carrier protein LolA [Gammaproteobacteria bacterium]